MNPQTETQRSFVNTWECDENDHLNVQFYWKRFGDASRIYQHLSGTQVQRWNARHVRYHRELRSGTNLTQVSTGVGNQIVHHLNNAETNTLAATAIDTHPDDFRFTGKFAGSVSPEASPLSLTTDHLAAVPTHAVVSSRGGLISHRSVITPQECDAEGVLLDQHHIARFSDAAGHFWQSIGVDQAWSEQHNLGSVAVEMSVSRSKLPTIGMILEVATWLESTSNKTLIFKHQVSDMTCGDVLYVGAVTALLMDLRERRAVRLPDFVRNLG